MKYEIDTVISTKLTPQQEIQYRALIEESKNEPMFDGKPLDPSKTRQVIVNEIGEVMGCFEIATREFEGRSYYNTNRPYLRQDFRGQGVMGQALAEWYKVFRPGIAWIANDNERSVHLFTSLGFKPVKAWPGKGKDGFFYILT